jgi:hypothetical protein
MKRAVSIACGALALCAGAILRAQEPAPADPVLVGAGDIADCKALSGAAKTALLLDHIEGTVFAIGDTAYESGAPKEFEDCYAPTWGRHKARTRPAVGNHEYRTDFANGYYNYFGAAGGDPTKGYYSYDLGQWHVVVANSNCKQVGGCKAGSPQEQWVRQDLAEHPAPCTVAMWHHPRYSSGDHGDDKSMRDIWKALYDAGADVVLSGHDHDYERFAPQDADSKEDPARGIRQFVVGTGGRDLYKWRHKVPGSEVKDNETFGVLKMTLHDDGYDWEFIPVEGQSFTDSGSAKCHPRRDPSSPSPGEP